MPTVAIWRQSMCHFKGKYEEVLAYEKKIVIGDRVDSLSQPCSFAVPEGFNTCI